MATAGSPSAGPRRLEGVVGEGKGDRHRAQIIIPQPQALILGQGDAQGEGPIDDHIHREGHGDASGVHRLAIVIVEGRRNGVNPRGVLQHREVRRDEVHPAEGVVGEPRLVAGIAINLKANVTTKTILGGAAPRSPEGEVRRHDGDIEAQITV